MSNRSNSEERPDTAFLLRAMQQSMERMSAVMENLDERVGRQEAAVANLQRRAPEGVPEVGRPNRRPLVDEENWDEEFENEERRRPYGGRDEYRGRRNGREGLWRPPPRPYDGVDRNLDNIKMKMPSFQGKNDPELYLEWEKRVEHVFDCHQYSEEKKVKLAVIEFSDYALNWWDQLVVSRRRNGERPIDNWGEMKAVMRKRFVPSHYYRELYQRLQRLNQGHRSVDEYFKEMEMTMVRASVEEDREATMARFLSGLNSSIANIVELHHYVELEDMVQMAIKVERQLKRKNSHAIPVENNKDTTFPTPTPNPIPPWRSSGRKEGEGSSKPNFENKGKEREMRRDKGKEEGGTVHRSRDINCYRCLGKGHYAHQCPNNRTMIVQANGEVATDDDSDEGDKPSLEEASDEEVYPVTGELLVVRRAPLDHYREIDMGSQRANIFQTRCHVSDKVCQLIIDSGSCTNIASTTLVEKLGLTTSKHPQPYKLQWLNDDGKVKVEEQVLVTFSIGRYKDEVICDVLPMQAGHVLLGRPWQYDRKVTYDGYRNEYSLEREGRKITLLPLTPRQMSANLIGEVEEKKGKRMEEEPKEGEGHSKGKKERKRTQKCLYSNFSFLQESYDERQNKDGLQHLPYDKGPNSRSNSFEEGGNDTNRTPSRSRPDTRREPCREKGLKGVLDGMQHHRKACKHHGKGREECKCQFQKLELRRGMAFVRRGEEVSALQDEIVTQARRGMDLVRRGERRSVLKRKMRSWCAPRHRYCTPRRRSFCFGPKTCARRGIRFGRRGESGRAGADRPDLRADTDILRQTARQTARLAPDVTARAAAWIFYRRGGSSKL